jgi:transposase
MSQQKEDFVSSVENALRFFEGTPAAIVPDNLKSAVIKSSRFEPTINETLADLAELQSCLLGLTNQEIIH